MKVHVKIPTWFCWVNEIKWTQTHMRWNTLKIEYVIVLGVFKIVVLFCHKIACETQHNIIKKNPWIQSNYNLFIYLNQAPKAHT